MSIDEALSTIIGATYTRWIEHRTESGNWSRRQHQKTRRILEPAQVRHLVKNPLPGEKRRHLRRAKASTTTKLRAARRKQSGYAK